MDFLIDVDNSYWDTRLAPDASWIYARPSTPRGALSIHVGTGEVASTRRLGTPAGSSINGSLLFGVRLDRETGRQLVTSINRSGTTRQVATIGWPELGRATEFPVIAVIGIQVTVPTD